MSVLATDNFNRTETPAASPWTKALAAGGNFNLNGAAAVPASSTSDTFWLYSGVSFPNDQYAQAAVTPIALAIETGPGVGVRISTAAGGSGYWAVANLDGTNTVYVSKWVAGAYTNIAIRTATWAAGDTIRLEVSGTSLKVFQNGVQLGAAITDASIASGSAGIAYSSTNAGSTIDTWEAGDFNVASTGDTYQPPLAGFGRLVAGQRALASMARIAQSMLFHLPQDTSFVPPPVAAPYVSPIPGADGAYRDSQADYRNRSLYSTVTLWGGGGDQVISDTWVQPIVGERAHGTALNAYQRRAGLATQLIWPVPNDQPPVNVASPPYQSPLVGERAMANGLRQQAIRAQLATNLLIFAPSNTSTQLVQPDTYQSPVVGERSLQAAAKAFAARSVQSNTLLWPVPQDPLFAPMTVPPLAGEGLWAKALQRQATQSRLATSLLIFSPSDTSAVLNIPDTYQPPIVGQGVYAAQQRLYRLGADRANRLLWTTAQNTSVIGAQPDTYQPPLAGDGVYRRVISENRRRAALASSLLFVGNRDPFVAQAFKPEWAIRAHTTIGFTIEPR